MNIPLMIKEKRLSLHETQDKFAARFGKTGTAVLLWEQGKRECGYKVLEFILADFMIDSTKEIYKKGWIDGQNELKKQIEAFLKQPNF